MSHDAYHAFYKNRVYSRLDILNKKVLAAQCCGGDFFVYTEQKMFVCDVVALFWLNR